jgi:LmbE family N-acetylglucosaminyl deacetylase
VTRRAGRAPGGTRHRARCRWSWRRSAAVLAAALVAGGGVVRAQGTAPDARGAAALGSALAGLGTTGRVLVIAAHPDDEDTNLIAWLARGRHVETAYLSLTRGDGGQNLIGTELGEALGVIRTQELLAARRIDGGRQYFTRAYDFGFSKTAEETLAHWPADTILGDVIRVVRAFRPHVIVAIFTGTPRDGHGHHQIAGRWAREAYEASADTVRYPVASHGEPWTVAKFYRNARFAPQEATLRMNVGEYDPLLGRSWAEIAAESRSQHKSQGFGVLQRKGVVWGYLRREAARTGPADPAAEQSLFDGVDTAWARLAARAADGAVRAALDSAGQAFAAARGAWRADDPTPAVAPLAAAVRLLRAAVRRVGEMMAEPGAVRHGQQGREVRDAIGLSLERAERALVLAAGVAVEATAPRGVFPVREPAKTGVNDSLPVGITVFNRGRTPVTVREARVPPTGGRGGRVAALSGLEVGRDVARDVAPDSQLTVERFAVAYAPTAPWWLAEGRAGDWFRAPIPATDEAARQATTAVQASVVLEVAGVPVTVDAPVVYRYADPVRGDRQVPVAAVPGITIGLDDVVQYLRADVPVTRELRVRVQSAYPESARVTVALRLPPGLAADSVERVRTLTPQAPGATLTFRLRGRVAPGRLELGAIALHEGTISTRGDHVIAYDHIVPQRLYGPSGLWLASVPVRTPPRVRVGYIPGPGDQGLAALRQLDVAVERLDPAALAVADLGRYTTIVVGTRAYEASDELVRQHARLLDFARRGGTLVVQYGAQDMSRFAGVLPHPLQWTRPAARVTVEEAPVTVLQPSHPLLTTPNRIGPDDWTGWVQERATYMPSTIAPQYLPLVAMQDPGEPEQRGGLLVTPLGAGRYVYVTLALFRQLPAGVPGAARLLMNLIAPASAAAPAPPASSAVRR